MCVTLKCDRLFSPRTAEHKYAVSCCSHRHLFVPVGNLCYCLPITMTERQSEDDNLCMRFLA